MRVGDDKQRIDYEWLNVDKVTEVRQAYMSCHYQKTKKKTELPRALNRCRCLQKKEENKGTSNIWYKKQERKGRTRSSEYPNTKIWRKRL